MNNFQEKMKPYAPFALRMGLAVVFLLFGAQKFYSAGQGAAEIDLILGIGMELASMLNFVLAILEIIIGISFVLGWYIKYTAPLATFLVAVFFGSLIAKYGISADPTLSRDIGLIGASFALWFLGAGRWSVDENVKR